MNGLVVYFHGTSLDRTGVPTGPDLKNYYKSLAALYVAKKYFVVMISYIGEGKFDSLNQPYVLFPYQNVVTGIASA